MNNLYLPKYAAQLVLRPGAKTGKGGNPHQYLIEGEKYQRVTTILDKTIPKPGLVPWARNVALADAKAALNNFAPLFHFETAEDYNAWVEQVMDHAKDEPDRVKDEAADWGTQAHNYIQSQIEIDIQNLNYWAEAPREWHPVLSAFRKLGVDLQIEWRATEMVVWSPTLRVAGTVDAIGQLPDGSWVIFDWKTSNAFYPEHALQLAAYASFFTEVTSLEVARGYVVRFPKKQPKPVNCFACTHGLDHEIDCEQPPVFEARQVRDLESTALHYEMLVEHFRWLAQSPWEKEE